MPLYVTESEVRRLVDMKDTIQALESCFAAPVGPQMVNKPRQRIPLVPRGNFNVMPAALGDSLGYKAYFTTAAGSSYLVALYSASEARLLAMIEASWLSQLRTGAATAIAARLLARPDAQEVGIIGTGKQARCQLLALLATRPLTRVRAFSRDPERRRSFCTAMTKELGLPVEPAISAQAAVAGAGLVIAVTKSAEPVLKASWLAAGTHVSGVGANAANRREVDVATVVRAETLVVDDLAQAKIEAAELIDLAAAGRLDWGRVVELGALARGEVPGRKTPEGVTYFKSLGIALEDVALARVIYEKATAQGAGRQF